MITLPARVTEFEGATWSTYFGSPRNDLLFSPGTRTAGAIVASCSLRWLALYGSLRRMLSVSPSRRRTNMLRSVKDMQDYAIRATDGTIGHVKDLYFDDEAWVVRYLIVDTGGWLSNRKVLISPFAIGHPDWAQKILPVSITKEQVKNSPHIDTERPVSRQHEMEYLGYYGYPNY
jgi:hypothetical protein